MDRQRVGPSLQQQHRRVRSPGVRGDRLDPRAGFDCAHARRGALMSPRIKQALPAIAGVILFVIAVAVLRVEIRTISWSGLIGSVLGMPRDRLLVAALLTVINYAALTGYDFLAFAYIRRTLPRAKIALTA